MAHRTARSKPRRKPARRAAAPRKGMPKACGSSKAEMPPGTGVALISEMLVRAAAVLIDAASAAVVAFFAVKA
jgi:hypothetical protein